MLATRSFARLAAVLSFAYILRGDFFGVPFTALELALLAVLVAYVVEKFVTRESFPDPRRMPYFWPLALLLVAATISVLVAPDKRAAAGIWKAYFLEPILVSIVLWDVLRTTDQVRKLIGAFFTGGIIVSVFELLAFAFAVGVHVPDLAQNPVVIIYNTPNATGLFLGPLLAMAAALILFGDRQERFRGAFFAVFAFPALILSLSRGAWLGLVAASLVLVWQHRHRLAMGGLVVAGVVVAVLIPPIRRRIQHQFDPNDPANSVVTRMHVWGATLKMQSNLRHVIFRDRPVGLQNRHPAVQELRRVQREPDLSPQHLSQLLDRDRAPGPGRVLLAGRRLDPELLVAPPSARPPARLLHRPGGGQRRDLRPWHARRALLQERPGLLDPRPGRDSGRPHAPARMSLAARTARNTALVVAARLVSKVFVFAVVLIVIRSMGQDNYGRFTSLVVYAALVSIVLDLGLRPLFTREVAKDRTRLTPYLNSILSLKLTLALPVLLILFLSISIGLMPLVPYVIPTFALLVATSFANQLRATFYAMGQLRYEGIAIIGESLVLLVAAVSVALLRLPWWYFIWAYAASYTFTVVYAAVIAVLRFDHRFAFDLQWLRLSMLARESLPFGLTFIISTLYFKIDVPILKFFTTFAAVGIYSAAYKYLEAVVFMPQTLMDPIFPALSQIAHENIDRLGGAATKAYKMLAVIGTPMMVVMMVLAAPIIRYTIPGFEKAIPVLQVLALGVLFLFVNNVFLYTLNAMGRQSDSTRLAVISLVVNVALNLVLIPQSSPLYGGYMGAAWATVLTEVGLFIGGWYLLRKHLVALPVISSLKGVLPSGVLCGIGMFGVVLALGPHLWVYALAVVVGMAAYVLGLYATHAFTPEEIALAREATRSLTRR